MKRELEREKRLPAFNLQLGDLELLWKRMLELFDTSKPLNSTIKLSLPSEKLEFESIDELRGYTALRGRVTNFSLRMSQGNRSVTVNTGGMFKFFPTVKVEAESDVWCAGAIEGVYGVIRANRVWYSWFIYAPFYTLFILFAFTPMAIAWFFPKAVEMPKPMTFAWLSAVLLFAFLSLTKERLLPAATISFTNEVGFIRRYGSEISLILGVVSLVLTIITMI
ncbi:hypothetical protein [Thiobacillus sp.]|mgnify:CR=1 FL=1|jgi:hypothetical protein|uniref:hypothetical protein n=1 Tax=Thiobacillus sp. TaxID=924 RepID=UPI0025D6B067|nr:hypothetical protein [Thiobacillus sp.]